MFDVEIAVTLAGWLCRCLIHFDGWSNRWDYWTALPNKDVHPVGWCQRNGVKLQPPKNHVGVFVWHRYLAEQGATAAPLGDGAAAAPAGSILSSVWKFPRIEISGKFSLESFHLKFPPF